MSVEQATFIVYGEHGELICELSTGQVIAYNPEDSETFDYADIAKVDVSTYEQTFRHRIQAKDRIDIVHFNFWTNLREYCRRTPMSTDPKPVDAAKQVTDYLLAEDQAMLDAVWQEAADARKADTKPVDIREQLDKIDKEEQEKEFKEADKQFVEHLDKVVKSLSSKEINDNFIEKMKNTSEVDHTGRDTVGEFLVTVHKDYNSKLVSVDYDFAKHCWILTAFECIAPTKMIIHRITFPHQSWTSDSVQEKRIKECIGALGLHPTTGVCSKTEVLDFLGFGEAFCLHKGDKPNG